MGFKLANVSDIPKNGAIIVRGPDGTEIALFNNHGIIYALNNSCPHMGGPLAEGDIEHGCVTCPWHGWQFELSTGTRQDADGCDAEKIAIEVIKDEIFLKS